MSEKLLICGGGALGICIAGTASSRGVPVSLLSPRSEQWHSQIKVFDCN